MSGVWGGWMRRLRRGQTAGAALAPADLEAGDHADADAPAATLEEAELSEVDGAAADRVWVSDAADVRDGFDERLPEEDTAPDVQEPQPPGTEPAVVVPTRPLLEAGELAACRAAVEHGAATELAPLVAALTEGEAVLRGLGLGADEGMGVMLAQAPGARRLLIVFGQDGGAFCMPPVPAEDPVHVLYIRDPSHCLAMLGVGGLGADYDACLLGVLRIARALGAADLFCLGGGVACYSALRYGLDLGAAGVLAAGNLDVVRRGVQAPGLRPGAQARRLMRLAAELGPDMAEAYAAAAERPGLVLCRPGQSGLAGLAALPGAISVEAPAGALARIVEWAEQSGHLRGMIRDLLTCRAAG